MDNQFYQQGSRRSRGMETASFVCGIIAVATACFVYTSLVCGSLAILFALLSRGGELTLTQKAKAGLVMGCAGLAFVLFMVVYTVAVAELYYGGLEEMMRQMYEGMGIDYDALFR